MEPVELHSLQPQAKEIGPGMWIQRYLPQPGTRQAIGPFVFFDYVAGLEFAVGTGVDVRPHPHIGLSTLTYLLAGRMHHRDSEGHDVIIGPGDTLLMTSGQGIVHSERTPIEDRLAPHSLHQFQLWLALPQAHECDDPSVHYMPVDQLPEAELQAGLRARLAIGEFAGLRAPVSSHGEPLLLDLQASQAGHWIFSNDTFELGLFVVSGTVTVAQQAHQGPTLLLLPPGEVALQYTAGARFLILGGKPLDGPRIIWWNLVASRPELIEAAKQLWLQGGFPLVPGDESEFIPLPPEPGAAANEAPVS